MKLLREALLRGRRRPRHSGAGSPTLFRGDGYEFVELREYAPGDDVRRVDWAATARTGALQTRVILEDVALTLAAFVDTTGSMEAGRTRPFSQAAREAVDAWFGCALSTDRCITVDALDVAPVTLPRGAALLVVGDFWDLPEDDGLLIELGRRFDCTALAARDPWGGALPLRGFVRVHDAESGASAALYLGRAQAAAYARAVGEREERLQERFARCNWRYGTFDCDEDGAVAVLRAFGFT